MTLLTWESVQPERVESIKGRRGADNTRSWVFVYLATIHQGASAEMFSPVDSISILLKSNSPFINIVLNIDGRVLNNSRDARRGSLPMIVFSGVHRVPTPMESLRFST